MRSLAWGALAAALLALPAGADDGARLVPLSAVYGSIDQAQVVTVAAYTLNSRSAMLGHLQAAGGRGAHVALVLTGDGMGYALSANRSIAACATNSPDAGACHGSRLPFKVLLTNEPLHMKCAVVDGSTVYVSDENFSSRGLVLQLPGRYGLAVERAALGDPHDDGSLTVTKGSSLAAEAALIDGAKQSVTLTTESFGANNPVYDALQRAVARHVRVRIGVNGREAHQDAIASFPLNTVTELTTDEKLALIDNSRAWIGSSNANQGVMGQVDFGYSTTDPQLVQQIAERIGELL
jgi:hypothetical protein